MFSQETEHKQNLEYILHVVDWMKNVDSREFDRYCQEIRYLKEQVERSYHERERGREGPGFGSWGWRRTENPRY